MLFCTCSESASKSKGLFCCADADHAAEVLAAKVHAELSKERKKEGPTMKARDQLTADDYIIPYVDDEDSDVEN